MYQRADKTDFFKNLKGFQIGHLRGWGCSSCLGSLFSRLFKQMSKNLQDIDIYTIYLSFKFFSKFYQSPFSSLFHHFLPACVPLYLILSKYTGLVNFVFMFLTVWYPWGSWWGSVRDHIIIDQKGTLLILEALCCCDCLLVKCTHKPQRGLSGQLRHNRACFKTDINC